MTEKIEDCGGILGNFRRRRHIQEETAASRPVGRTRPRMREDTPGSALWNELHTDERLMDEEV
jgi:hypothetical protein